jgi:hypothetical protein
MSFVHAALLFAQEAQDEVVIDAAAEGKKVIIGMLIVGLIFISVIALGQLSKWVAHRREARRPTGY